MSSNPESPIPSQIFPLAHPPPKPPQRLRLTPRLVLQIQQLASSTGRAVPVLEVLRPSRLGRTLAVGAGAGAARVKLSSRGLYIAQSEPFLHLPGSRTALPCDAIAAISSLAPRGAPAADVLYFASADSWEVHRSPRGYRFQQVSAGGQGRTLEWEERPRASEERFVLRVVAAAAEEAEDRRLATLTKRGMKVSAWDRGLRAYLAAEEETVYTWVLTMGVYVAAQEGWVCV
ncbi:hypothetical protein AFLA70_141g002511 [Aspergillus terreus]|uniref:Uncharacterized protein n=1 Tax=Aspergillus terreus TaxID=33178 RepID=A0A5M3Z586_ASPTE|nr:hypothetical protein ATETN484_0007034300 [Aspergillus terreus]GFF16148.1 hypothetical protein AFLA70_141g002511 [Aspergillus terreus]